MAKAALAVIVGMSRGQRAANVRLLVRALMLSGPLPGGVRYRSGRMVPNTQNLSSLTCQMRKSA